MNSGQEIIELRKLISSSKRIYILKNFKVLIIFLLICLLEDVQEEESQIVNGGWTDGGTEVEGAMSNSGMRNPNIDE